MLGEFGKGVTDSLSGWICADVHECLCVSYIWHCLCLNAMLIDRLFVIVTVVCDKDYMLCEVKLTLDVIIPELVEK